MSADIDPIRLFQEELLDDDYEVMIRTVDRLTSVAIAVGPARTRSELIPVIANLLKNDCDEAHTSIARQLADWTELVGGLPHIQVLLELLEQLSAAEEYIIRHTAAQSIITLTAQLSPSDITTKIVPIIKRLANGDWFTTRVTSTELFTPVYPAVNEQTQTELRALFNNLCNDDTPMVRKAAFIALSSLAGVLSTNHIRSDIYPIVRAISVDDMDSFRVYAIDAATALTAVVDSTEYTSVILPLIEVLQDDSSWRVRHSLAQHLAGLIPTTIDVASAKRLLALFIKLLKDKESEVRAAAAEKIDVTAAAIAGITGKGNPASGAANANAGAAAAGATANGTIAITEKQQLILDQLGPLLEALSVDTVQSVRVGFSQSVVGLCPVLGSEGAVKYIIPILHALSRDEHYEVRYAIINRLDLIADALGANGLITSVLSALTDMAKDIKWRVRMGVIQKSYLLAHLIGVKLFDKKILPILIAALSDHVFAIRHLACEQLGQIVQIPEFACAWAIERLFPQAFLIYNKNTNYLHRMTCLLLIEKCIAPTDKASHDGDIPQQQHNTNTNNTNINTNNNVITANTSFTTTPLVNDPSQATAVHAMIEKHMLPLILQSLTDDVANVRIAACKTLIVILPHTERKAISAAGILPILTGLVKDSDGDVNYFASVAIKLMS